MRITFYLSFLRSHSAGIKREIEIRSKRVRRHSDHRKGHRERNDESRSRSRSPLQRSRQRFISFSPFIFSYLSTGLTYYFGCYCVIISQLTDLSTIVILCVRSQQHCWPYVYVNIIPFVACHVLGIFQISYLFIFFFALN